MKNTILKYWLSFALILFAGAFFSSCSGLLEADNPNNLLEDDLDDPRSVGSMVNGVQASLTRAVSRLMSPYATASDELKWVGSRNGWQQLQAGNLGNPNNEFTDDAFFYIGEARWWSDEVLRRIENFDKNGRLLGGDEVQWARAYLYAGIAYVAIADMFDDFVITSDKREAGLPVGDAGMNGLYDVAIGYFNNGLALGGLPKDLEASLSGMLARAHYSKALWAKVNPVNVGDPLVSAADAVAAAQKALDIMDVDFKFILDVDPTTPDVAGGNGIGQQVNERLEMRISSDYIIADGTDKQVASLNDGDPATSISLMDPIDNIPDPVIYAAVVDFVGQAQFTDFTIVSAREMLLILAEAALAQDNMTDFRTHINAIRDLDGLTAYDNQIDALKLLKHERRVNLFLQGRRIADHYRFNEPAPTWEAASDAQTNPGTFFPITITEIRANPNIN